MLKRESLEKLIQENCDRLCHKLKLKRSQIDFLTMDNKHQVIKAAVGGNLPPNLCAGWTDYISKTKRWRVCINHEVVKNKKDAFITLVHELLHVKFDYKLKIKRKSKVVAEVEEDFILCLDLILGNVWYREFYGKKK